MKIKDLMPKRKPKTSTAKKVGIGAGAVVALAGLVGAALKVSADRRARGAAAGKTKPAPARKPAARSKRPAPAKKGK